MSAGARDDLGGGDRGGPETAHEGQHHQPGPGGGQPGGQLQVRRQVPDRAEHRRTEDEPTEHGDDEGAVPEQERREQGLGRAPLDADQRPPTGQGQAHAGGHPGHGHPGAGGRRDDQGDEEDRRGEQGGPGDVEVYVGPRGSVTGQVACREDEGHGTERHVEPERPPPPHGLGEPATEEGSGDRREGEDGTDGGHDRGPAALGDEVGDDGVDEHEERAPTKALHGPRRDEGGEVGGEPAERGAGHEHGQRREEDPAPAEEVPEPAEHGHHHRAGDEVGRRRPEQTVPAPQLPGDGGQGRGEHRGVQLGEREAHHERGEDRAQARRGRDRHPGFRGDVEPAHAATCTYAGTPSSRSTVVKV